MKTKKKTKGYFAGGIALAAQMATDAAGNYVKAANYQFDPNKDPYKIDPVSALKAGPLTLIPEIIKWQKDKEQRNSHIAYASPGNYAVGGQMTPAMHAAYRRNKKGKNSLIPLLAGAGALAGAVGLIGKNMRTPTAVPTSTVDPNAVRIMPKEQYAGTSMYNTDPRWNVVNDPMQRQQSADYAAMGGKIKGYKDGGPIDPNKPLKFLGRSYSTPPETWEVPSNPNAGFVDRRKGIIIPENKANLKGIYTAATDKTPYMHINDNIYYNPYDAIYTARQKDGSYKEIPETGTMDFDESVARNYTPVKYDNPLFDRKESKRLLGGQSAIDQHLKQYPPKPRKGGYAMGGQIEDVPLTDNSFQVKGAPNKRDGNHYPEMNANLDHNEVVKGNFVFSNRLKNPTTGKPFAAEAKVLEAATGKAQRILKANPNDPFANNTINLSNSRIENLAKLQEAHATSMGLRDNKTKNLAVGGYADGPGDPLWPGVGGMDISRIFKPGPQPKPNQPYMHLKGDYYYDPYTQSYMWRNPITGSYKKETGDPGFGTGRGFRPYFKKEGDVITPLATTTQDTEVNPISISKHLSQFPDPSKTELTLPWNVPENTTPIPQDIPTSVKPRTGGTGKVKSTGRTGMNSPLDYQDEYNIDQYDKMKAKALADMRGAEGEWENSEGYNQTTAEAEYDSRQAATAGDAARKAYEARQAPPQNPDEAAYDAEMKAKAATTAAGKVAGASDRYKVPFTAGDALQLGAIGSRFAQLIGGADKEKANYDTTKITKENYDPANALYQANRSFQNASNTIDAPSINTRRSIQNSLYAQRIGQENNILSEYDQRNQGANTQYEGRIADQRRYNNQQTVLTNDLNQRNKDAYRNAVTSAFDTLGNYGKGLNTKKQGGDIMNILKVSYPDVYARIIGGLMEEGTKKAKTT